MSGSIVLGDVLLSSGARRACLVPTTSVTVSMSRFLVASIIGALGDSCRPEEVKMAQLNTRGRAPRPGDGLITKGSAGITWGICMGWCCWKVWPVSTDVSSGREPSQLSLRAVLARGQDRMALREREP